MITHYIGFDHHPSPVHILSTLYTCPQEVWYYIAGHQISSGQFLHSQYANSLTQNLIPESIPMLLFLLLVQLPVTPTPPALDRTCTGPLRSVHHAANPASHSFTGLLVGPDLRLAVDDGYVRWIDVEPWNGACRSEPVAIAGACSLDTSPEIHRWYG
jgi:hypothetical protein